MSCIFVAENFLNQFTVEYATMCIGFNNPAVTVFYMLLLSKVNTILSLTESLYKRKTSYFMGKSPKVEITNDMYQMNVFTHVVYSFCLKQQVVQY